MIRITANGIDYNDYKMCTVDRILCREKMTYE